MDWLNTYASAIQALGAVVSALATVALIVITWRYVALTRALAETATQQLDFQRASARAQREELRRELLACAKHLRSLLAHLPTDRSKAEGVRDVAMWKDEDLANFQRVASQYDEMLGQRAAVIVGPLRWIKEQVTAVQSTPRERGFDWNRFAWQRWVSEVQGAAAQVGQIFLEAAACRNRDADSAPEAGRGPA